MRIAAIEPLGALSAEEAALLRELLAWDAPDAPDIDPASLVVYVVTTPEGGYEKVVSPASETLGIGMTVIASDFTATATRTSTDPGEEPTLAVASALLPHDQDM